MPQPMDFTPKKSQTEVGRQAWQQYLQLAQRIIDEPTMDYAALYKRFQQSSSTMTSPSWR